MEFDDVQKAAIDHAVDPAHSNAIITGGAGTGKTTIIKAIAAQLIRKGGMPVDIMAPTGKAAARLKEATGYDACTIHRALMWDGGSFHKKNDFIRPVIIDESSMIDSWLMAQIIRYNPPKLILVGDASQLPPVGKGQPFHDLLKLRPELSVELTTCYRAQGAIHQAALAIREGKRPAMVGDSGGESWKMMDTGRPGKTTAKLVSWVKAGHYDPKQDTILATQYGQGEPDDGGIRSLNKAVKAVVNPSVEPFAVNDRILCNKNFGPDDLWNGDLGFVTDIDASDHLWVVLDRDPEPRLLNTAQMREITHAYCLSVHKSQGSQFRRVFFCAFRAHINMMTRAMVYTAITRAQSGVCVMGELAAFYRGINTVDQKQTVLQGLSNAVQLG